MSKKIPYNTRVVPPVMKDEIDLGFFRKFTLKERLQILIGYNIRNSILIHTQHSPGHVNAKVGTEVTNDVEPKETL